MVCLWCSDADSGGMGRPHKVRYRGDQEVIEQRPWVGGAGAVWIDICAPHIDHRCRCRLLTGTAKCIGGTGHVQTAVDVEVGVGIRNTYLDGGVDANRTSPSFTVTATSTGPGWVDRRGTCWSFERRTNLAAGTSSRVLPLCKVHRSIWHWVSMK
ncbi:hypothetical protein BDZ97DRAFT_1866868 [Flammula alnicola]|nr:hypothetical protein BDZ97DRAFT_1866868 [Flammula alnicola]